MCRKLTQSGVKVVAVVRSSNEQLLALKPHQIIIAEITEKSGIQKITSELGNLKLDIVIHNAGVYPSDNIENLSSDQFNQAFQVNAVAPMLLSSALLPNLSAGSKLIFITSRMGSIADNGSGGSYAYRMSKAALNMGAVSMAKDLKSKEIIVGILHPGMVETDMTSRFGVKAGVGVAISVELSAEKILERTEQFTLEKSGQFQHAITGEVLPW